MHSAALSSSPIGNHKATMERCSPHLTAMRDAGCSRAQRCYPDAARRDNPRDHGGEHGSREHDGPEESLDPRRLGGDAGARATAWWTTCSITCGTYASDRCGSGCPMMWLRDCRPRPKQGPPRTRCTRSSASRSFPYPIGNIHPRLWGWVFGTGTVAGALAGLFADTMDSNGAGINFHTAAHVEHQVVGWCKETARLPRRRRAACSRVAVRGPTSSASRWRAM